MHSRTVSLPARYAASTVIVWAPFRIRTLRSRYGVMSAVQITSSPAAANGSSSSSGRRDSITQEWKISPVTSRSSW